MDLSEYARVLARRWPALLAATLLGIVVGVLSAPAGHARSAVIVRPKYYSATYYLALNPSASTSSGGASSATPNLQSMAFLTTAGPVPKDAAQRLAYNGPPAMLATQVQASSNDTVGTLSITASDLSASRAALVANTFAASLIGYLGDLQATAQQQALQRINASLDAVQKQIVALDQQISGAARIPAGTPVEVLQDQRSAYSSRYTALFDQYLTLVNVPPPSSPLVTVQAATPLPQGGQAPVRTKIPSGRPARAAIGGLVGLLLGAGLAVGTDLLDPRLRTRQAAERAFGLPVLAEVPEVARPPSPASVVVAAQPASPGADAYRVLRASLLLGVSPGQHGPNGNGANGDMSVSEPPVRSGGTPRGPHGQHRVLMVTSAEQSQGSSAVVANLAASFAEAGGSVLVIGADFRRPTVHRYLGAPGAPGLRDVLAEPGRHRLVDVVVDTAVPGVRLIPSGTPVANQFELLTRVGRVVAQARGLADLVIVDVPPLIGASDAGEMIPAVDGVLLVCRQFAGRAARARQAAELVGRFSAPMLGVTLVMSPRRLVPMPPRRVTARDVVLGPSLVGPVTEDVHANGRRDRTPPEVGQPQGAATTDERDAPVAVVEQAAEQPASGVRRQEPAHGDPSPSMVRPLPSDLERLPSTDPQLPPPLAGWEGDREP